MAVSTLLCCCELRWSEIKPHCSVFVNLLSSPQGHSTISVLSGCYWKHGGTLHSLEEMTLEDIFFLVHPWKMQWWSYASTSSQDQFCSTAAQHRAFRGSGNWGDLSKDLFWQVDLVLKNNTLSLCLTVLGNMIWTSLLTWPLSFNTPWCRFALRWHYIDDWSPDTELQYKIYMDSNLRLTWFFHMVSATKKTRDIPLGILHQPRKVAERG